MKKRLLRAFASFVCLFFAQSANAFFDMQWGIYGIEVPDLHFANLPYLNQGGKLSYDTGGVYAIYSNGFSLPIEATTMLDSKCKFQTDANNWAFGCVGWYYENGGVDLGGYSYANPVFWNPGGWPSGLSNFDNFSNPAYDIGSASEFVQDFGLRLFIDATTSEIGRSENFFPASKKAILYSYPLFTGRSITLPDNLISIGYSPGQNFSISYALTGAEESYIAEPKFRYYEINSYNFTGTASDVTYYNDIFIGYVSNTGGNSNYLNNSTEGDYSTFVMRQSGTNYYVQQFNCWGKTINDIKTSCGSPVVEGYLSDSATFMHYFSRHEITYDVYHSGFVNPAVRFTNDGTNDYFVTSLNKQYPYSYLISTITPEDIVGTLLDDITSTQEAYTPPGGIINYTGTTVGSSSGFSTNVFGNISMTGYMFFECSPEYSGSSFHLRPSDIPVVDDIRYIVDLIPGITLPDVDLLGPLSCPRGAFQYGSQNSFQTPTLSGDAIQPRRAIFSGPKRDNFVVIMNLFLILPFVYLSYKILK